MKIKEREDGWVELQTEGATLALHKDEAAVGRETEINFFSEDIDYDYKELSRRGVRFQGPPKKTLWGGTLARFFDEEGNSFWIEG